MEELKGRTKAYYKEYAAPTQLQGLTLETAVRSTHIWIRMGCV